MELTFLNERWTGKSSNRQMASLLLFILIGLQQGQPGRSILNCLLAHQLCAEDGSCTSMLTVIRHICGPETVACSTTTVTKCQAGLRTLQAFPVFHPTCLCREPALDPDCNAFRDFLFDHPCMVSSQKEKDMYPIHALPTCTHALEVCLKDASCLRLYGDFREHCKRDQGICRDRETCHNAWRGLRMTPLFGCFCPSSQSKKCERLYTFIYNNTCVGNFHRHVAAISVGHDGRRGRRSLSLLLNPSWADDDDESTKSQASTAPALQALGTINDDDKEMMKQSSIGSWLFQQQQSQSEEGGTGTIVSRLIQDRSILNDSSTETGLVDVSRLSHFGYNAFAYTSTTSTTNGSKNPNKAMNGEGSEGTKPSETEQLQQRVVSIYQSTCQRALGQCQSDGQCRRHLDPFLRYCNGGESGTCHRDLCMQSLQGFYKDAPLQWSLEVAFCVCKKSENRADECLLAQEKLHPDCARRPERYPVGPVGPSTGVGSNEASPAQSHFTPACHHLAEECRAHPDCKPRLEFYVQACAVDVATKGCAGPPSVCRRAVLDILGTDLRTSCTCRSAFIQADMAVMYDCSEWQRLLWLNPCVVEAQRDFHKIQGNLKVITLPSSSAGAAANINYTRTSTGYETPSTSWTTSSSSTITRPSSPRPRSTTMSTTTTTRPGGIRTSDVTRSSSTWSTTENPEEMNARPTIPSRLCTLERTNKRIIHFPEGSSKRLYHEDDPDCSELCRCGYGQVVTCSISDCAMRKPCRTASAIYAHASTAFQAYRGECLCFSGAFVCAKPDPSQYSLTSGVFLFLGYSKLDERAIYQFTQQNASKFFLHGIQRLLYDPATTDPENECRISVHDQSEENWILQIRLASLDFQRANDNITLEMLTLEKGKCVPAANRIRKMVSKRLPEIREDEFLSVIKVSDVVSVLPEPRRSRSSGTPTASPKSFLILTVALAVTFFIHR